jgi:hypothetical protein
VTPAFRPAGVDEPSGGDEVGFEIDSCLDAIGFPSYMPINDAEAADEASSAGGITNLDSDPGGFGWTLGSESGVAPHPPQWFRVSQQMMGLMDNEHVLF